MATNPKLLHVSDLHLKNFGERAHNDLDNPIRVRLIDDIEQFVDHHGPIDGILINGDLAFSGNPKEYEKAEQLLERMVAAAKCAADRVWLVPGNHDVNRNSHSAVWTTTKNDILQIVDQDRISEASNKFWSYISNPSDAQFLLKPLQAYRDFAVHYDCDTSEGRLFWEDKETFRLNDGSRLILRGINSSTMCCAKDRKKNIILGLQQMNFARENGDVYAVMCHHPDDWLGEWDDLKHTFNNEVSIVLFGHKHTQYHEETNKKSLRFGAGALHPDRGENRWEPRYNIMKLSVTNTGEPGGRKLHIEHWPRVWDINANRFIGASSTDWSPQAFNLELPDWKAPKADTILEPIMSSGSPTSPTPLAPMRRLVFELTSLPILKIQTIASDLELISEETMRLPYRELVQNVIVAARTSHRLSELWQAVHRASGGDLDDPNPFTGAQT